MIGEKLKHAIETETRQHLAGNETPKSLACRLTDYGYRDLARKVLESAETIASVQREISQLAQVKYVVETNEGTYGPEEAARKVGTGDPMFATRRVYETVAGQRTETGPDAEDAPGYTRQVNAMALSAERKKLQALEQRLQSLLR